jgi:hypothetical protein
MTAESAIAIIVLSHIYSTGISVPLVSDFPGHDETNILHLQGSCGTVQVQSYCVGTRAVQGVRSEEIRATVRRARSLLDSCFPESAYVTKVVVAAAARPSGPRDSGGAEAEPILPF